MVFDGCVSRRLIIEGGWRFILYYHPIEFLSSVLAVICVAYFMTKYLWFLVPKLGGLFIQSAHAQDQSGAVLSLGMFEVNVQWFAVLFLSVILLWFMGIVSWSTRNLKVRLARDNLKSLVGFFIGLATGSGLSEENKKQRVFRYRVVRKCSRLTAPSSASRPADHHS